MRYRNTCPKCENRELLVVNPWRQPQTRTANTTYVMRLTSIEKAGKGFLAAPDRVEVGAFELWVCSRCGYSELYAAGVQELAQLADQGHPEVRRVVGK